ncbi:glutathione S-transferase [Columba guinea]|nr:glutathione S-transferase [Columba guinea]
MRPAVPGSLWQWLGAKDALERAQWCGRLCIGDQALLQALGGWREEPPKYGFLLFQQVPMVEIDGMKMVQTRAILNYIAAKYNLYGKDLKERALIDMYVEGLFDLNELIMHHCIQPADKKEQHLATIVDKATNRYFPVFEKVLKDHGQDFLVGNRFSRADVQLLEVLLMAEECKPDILAQFPLLQFEEEFIEKKEDLEKLRNDGSLMFQQVPMVEIDGMKMVQSRAILNYIAAKYNLYGKDLKERAWIDMYVEGTTDLMGMIMHLPFQPADTKEKNLALIIERATTRYFPVYEKALKDHGHDYLVGNKLSWADIHLLEAILMVEECKPDVLSAFPLLQAFKGRTSNIPTIKKFLQPGSQRKPPPDEKSVANVKKIFNM